MLHRTARCRRNERERVSLFDMLGKEPAISAVVDDFYDRVLSDHVLEPWFRAIDLDLLKAHQREYLAVALGGPERYEGRSLREAHSGLAITPAAFDRLMDHLADALAATGADEHSALAVTKRLRTMRAAVVHATI